MLYFCDSHCKKKIEEPPNVFGFFWINSVCLQVWESFRKFLNQTAWHLSWFIALRKPCTQWFSQLHCDCRTVKCNDLIYKYSYTHASLWLLLNIHSLRYFIKSTLKNWRAFLFSGEVKQIILCSIKFWQVATQRCSVKIALPKF